jgi:hypothetical protein
VCSGATGVSGSQVRGMHACVVGWGVAAQTVDDGWVQTTLSYSRFHRLVCHDTWAVAGGRLGLDNMRALHGSFPGGPAGHQAALVAAHAGCQCPVSGITGRPVIVAVQAGLAKASARPCAG